MVSKSEKGPNYYTVSALKDKEWTDASIRDFLGEEDTTRPNSHGWNAAWIRLYLADRVDTAQKSEAFLAWMERSAKRRSGAQMAVRTKTNHTIAMVKEAVKDVPVPVIPIRSLVKEAIGSWRCLDFDGSQDRYASLDSDPTFLARITENYLRHELISEYDKACANLYSRVGKDFAYSVLRDIVDHKIGATYPNLHGQILTLQSDLDRSKPRDSASKRAVAQTT